MTLQIRNKFPKNVYELIGRDENSATYALGWALEQSPIFAKLLVERLAGRIVDTNSAFFHLQAHGEDRGYTDIEIRCGSEFDAILEAKIGFEVPRLDQLSKYRPRLNANAATRMIVSVSAIRAEIARLELPPVIDGVPVAHLSWGSIRAIAKSSRQRARSVQEKLWLAQFVDHLENYAAMSRFTSNYVYVVSLGSKPMVQGGTHTWIDVVEKDNSYFHPVGKTFPKEPPNYIAFRYRGKVQSVHRIESYEIVRDISTKNPLWIPTNDDHFVYRLGPPMRPVRELRAAVPGDTVQQSARVWCAIDTLLSGQFDLLGDAVKETKRREAEAEAAEL